MVTQLRLLRRKSSSLAHYLTSCTSLPLYINPITTLNELSRHTWTQNHCWTDDDVTWKVQLKGPDAPTESERTAHEITHLPPASWCETCKFGRGIEAVHVRFTPLERDERPIIAVDFAVRKARADDGGADDDLETFLAIVDSSTGCMRAIASETEGATDYLASSVADFVKNFFVGRFRLRCPRSWRWQRE